MKKIFKKSLAVAVAAALCLTAFIGCLSVSAENGAGTIVAGEVSANPGESVQVPVTLTSTDGTGIAAARFDVTYASALTLTAIDCGENANVSYNNNGEGVPVVIDEEDGTSKIRIIVEAKNVDGQVVNFDSAVVTLSFDVAADAEGDLAVNIDTIDAANVAENYAILAGTNGKVTVVTEEHVHTWGELEYALVDGVCVTKRTCTECDEAETLAEIANPTLGHAPVYGDDLTLIFRINTNLIAPYSDVEAVFAKELFEGTATEDGYAPEVSTVLPETYSSTRQQFVYKGIRAKEMSSNINIKVFGVDADGNKLLLATEDYSMVTYIKTAYNARKDAADGTKNAAERQLIVDTANYGAAAQVHFNYNVENLANAEIPQDYASATITEFEGQLEQSAAVFGRAPDYKNKVLINVRFNKTIDNKAAAKVVIDYKNTAGEALSVTVDAADFTNYSSTRYQVVYDKMTAATMSSPFTFTVYDAEGNSLAYFTYSMEVYASQATASSTTSVAEKTLINRLIAYGRSAKAYLTF